MLSSIRMHVCYLSSTISLCAQAVTTCIHRHYLNVLHMLRPSLTQPVSALDDSDWPELDHEFGDPSIVARFNYLHQHDLTRANRCKV